MQSYNRNDAGTPEEKVLRYIATHDHKPLVFSKQTYNAFSSATRAITLPKDVTDVAGMVMFTILQTRVKKSLYMVSRGEQCRPYARRSSFDIWRHIRYYNPDIDLFSVMRCIAGVYEVNISYCPTVHKLVIIANSDDPTHLRIGRSRYNEYFNIRSEYGVGIRYWHTIGE